MELMKMLFILLLLLLLSLSKSLSSSTSLLTSISTSSNIDSILLSSLSKKINDCYEHHQELLGDFSLPIDLSSTLEMIVMKNSDPFITATESIGDNIKSVSSWKKVDNKLYTRDISYIHNRKSSSSSSFTSLFGPKTTNHDLIQVLSLQNNIGNHHHHDHHAKLVGYMNLSHVPYCSNTSYTTLWEFCGRDDNKATTNVKVSLNIDGIPPSMYRSLIKNSIITDLKHYVEEFRLASMSQLKNNYHDLHHLNNDEQELLNIINYKDKISNTKSISSIVNANKLDTNFWTLPSNDYSLPVVTILGSYLISSSSSSLSLFKNSNIASKLRLSFRRILMKTINIRKIF